MEQIRDYLVLAAACCSALLTIYNFLAAPFKKYKKMMDERQDAIAEKVVEKLAGQI